MNLNPKKILVLPLGLIAQVATADTNWSSTPVDTDFNNASNWTSGAPVFSGATTIGETVSTTISSAGTQTKSLRATSGAVVTVDTGVYDLTIDATQGADIEARGAGGTTSLTLRGDFKADGTSGFTIRTLDSSGNSVVLDGAKIGVSSGSPALTFQGAVTLANGAEVSSGFSSVSFRDQAGGIDTVITISGNNTINDNLTLTGGPQVAFNNSGDILNTDSVSGTGTWAFDASAIGNSGFNVTGDLNLSNIDLSITGTPVNGVIATYSGSLTGTGKFSNDASIVLGPGQSIDYNFGPMGNQVAIVPEVSLLTPILAGFLPLLAFRRRTRR